MRVSLCRHKHNTYTNRFEFLGWFRSCWALCSLLHLYLIAVVSGCAFKSPSNFTVATWIPTDFPWFSICITLYCLIGIFCRATNHLYWHLQLSDIPRLQIRLSRVLGMILLILGLTIILPPLSLALTLPLLLAGTSWTKIDNGLCKQGAPYANLVPNPDLDSNFDTRELQTLNRQP